ncbi:MAG: TRAP transporter substrate-binding protein DctP [Gammaproteobacteria bacterium]|nr:TRAP transporter substrate-binding protein DctP [Gammaproteobacteria bacterium]
MTGFGRFCVFIILEIAAGACFSRPVYASDIVWRFNNTHVEKRPESGARKLFADRIYELTAGDLQVKVFHGDSLGVAKADILRALRIGAIEMSTLFPAYLGRDDQTLPNVLNAGVIFNVDEEIAILPVLMDIYREIYDSWNIEVVGWQLTTPWQLSVLCNDPVDTLKELQDKKLRVYHKGLVNIFRKLGVAAQLIPAGEFYLAMQTGVVDCGVHSVALAHTLSLQEVADYASKVSILTGLTAIGVNKDVWNSLPDNLKAAVKLAGDELLEQSVAEALTKPKILEARYAGEYAESKELIVLDPFPETDLAAFYTAAVEHWEEEAMVIGGKANSYRLRVVNALDAWRRDHASAR